MYEYKVLLPEKKHSIKNKIREDRVKSKETQIKYLSSSKKETLEKERDKSIWHSKIRNYRT